jgi:5'-nucleotidase
MIRLYIDLDGVMADFDKYFLDTFGVESGKLDDPTLWKWINGHGNFFLNLPLMPGALDFFNSVKHLNPTILTACPKSNYTTAAVQKRQWVYKHLSSEITVIPMMGGKNKCLFMHSPGDVLIDDFDKNCIPWREHGGIAIHHKDFDTTKRELRKVYPFELGADKIAVER